MEKRLFLAIGLSMVVVWLWSLNAPKTPPSPLSKSSQPADINKVMSNSGAQQKEIAAVMPDVESPKVDPKANEVLKTLDTGKLQLTVSNIGANINKIAINEYDDTVLPLSGIMGLPDYDGLSFDLLSSSSNQLSYAYDNNNYRITKSYSVGDEYTVKVNIGVKNKTDMSKLFNEAVTSYVIEMSNLDEKVDRVKARDLSLNEYAINLEKGIKRKGGAYKFSPKEKKEEFGHVFWSGFRNKYFCLLVKPQYETKGYGVDPLDEKSLKVDIKTEEVTIPAGGNVQFDSIIYAGPERISTLKEYGLGFEKIQQYYNFALFDGIAKIISSLMQILHGFVPSWGACIILISVIIYFSMYPLTMRGMLSMKRMQALQPMIANLKEKYKDNPQKMNKEMMELYKEHKVNPLGGCLPMLLQMPVFIGLYQVLSRNVDFKGANFLWIKDLSQPDRLFTLPFSAIIIGNEINILPFAIMILMIVQQKMTAKNMVITDPAQASQQKMMATIMPIFLWWIFYKFASGLTLYFTMFYLFSTFTQWKMAKTAKAA